ncbi:GntR family transcriptional regulator [Kineothrix alysoides]|uniref:GntR family transcriptional regulator n=1 Tax=Kineothrix alysoides TaxID=1469948 RepID=A0A4R1QQ87_9FIRM|nr:GntR family transcriptional regulator [Kineothrix alysoides]TCL55976.1 GntR family transcriptional regulator [Kineothrix alysoides]
MNIRIRTDNNLPIYEQIVGDIKKAIINSEILPGDMLPSIRSLARGLEVSIITTKRAYEELEKEGLIYSETGKGFYVKKPDTKKLREEQLREMEGRLEEWIQEGKKLNLTMEEMQDMIKELY